MAIIKCPECGRQVSERAPLCPNCGVEIAGKIIRCTECGEVYFAEDRLCPACHHLNGVARKQPSAPVNTLVSTAKETVSEPKVAKKTAEDNGSNTTDNGTQEGEKKGKSYGALIVSFIFAAVICGAMFYFYSNSQSEKEEQEYELAIKSSDQLTLQAYLDKFKDNPEHIKKIEDRLRMLQQLETDWENVLASDSYSAYVDYITNNPESSHRQVALNKIDSIDWATANSDKENIEANLSKYIAKHPDGNHVSDARAKIEEIKIERENTTVSATEREMIVSLHVRFFQAINSRSDSNLRSTISNNMRSFNGKSGANADTAVEYMEKQYKNSSANFNWHIDKESFDIKKNVTPEGEKTFDVTFNTTKKTDGNDGTKTEEKHTVSTTVTSDFHLSTFLLR